MLCNRPNFDECCSCIYEALTEGVEKMTGHLALRSFYGNTDFR